MNLNKPIITTKLNNGNLPLTSIKTSSEYIPLFTILDGLPAPFSSSYGFINTNFIGIADDKFKNITIKYRDKDINRWLFALLSRLNGVRSSTLPNIKKALLEWHKIAVDWIFSEYSNNYIPNYRNGRSAYWDRLTLQFKQCDGSFLSSWNFVDTPIESTYGYIAEIVDKRIHSPLICLMVKKENIPFVRANWLMDIPIPDGVVEGWVLDEIDSPKYPKQSLRKNFKEKIFPEITNQGIPIIKKTREEMDGIWFHYKEPVFKTVAARNKWLEELSKKFIASEKQRLQIAEKPKFSFSSVKTGIRESIPVIEGEGILSAIVNHEGGVYSPNAMPTLQDFEQLIEDINNRSRTTRRRGPSVRNNVEPNIINEDELNNPF